MTASFEHRAANIEFKVEISGRGVAEQEPARKKNWSARTELREKDSKHRRGSYEQQETSYERRVSGQLEASIVEQIANSLQRGRRSDWLEARNLKLTEQ